MKAKFIGAVHDGWQHTELEYEYRGKRYFVTKHNNGYMDASLRQQHEAAQKDIDDRLDNPPATEPGPYEGSGQEGFDLFWEYVNSV